jgi:hypothetical protein
MGFFMRGGLGLTAFFAFVLGLSGCSNPGMSGGTCGTEVEDPYQLAGCVEKDDGDAGVDVRVSAIPNNRGMAKHGSSGAEGGGNMPAAVEFTDKNGQYKFKGLEKGEYTLYFEYLDTANDDVQADRLDGAYVLARGVNSLGSSRLKPASTLIVEPRISTDTGAVVGAKCHIERTPYSGITEESGLLIFYALPGTYHVLCEKGTLKSQPYTAKLEGPITTAPVLMTEGGLAVTIPLPSNVVANLDTTTGIVRVSWSKPATNELFQYRIRRLELEKIDLLVGWEDFKDTILYDPVFAGEPDTVTSKTIQYNVVSNRGAMYSSVVYSNRILAVRGPSAKVGFLDAAQSFCVVGDTAKLLGTYKSRLNHNARVLWTTRSPLDTLQDTRVDNRQGSDTLSYPCLAPGAPSLEFRVKDETGITSITRFKFEIVPSP